MGNVHESEKKGREKLPDDQKENAAQYGYRHDRMDRRLAFFFVFSAHVSGDDHIGAHGKSEKKVDDEIDDGAVAADGGNGLSTDEMPDDGDIRGDEKLLHDAAESDGQSKQDEFTYQRAVQHIHVLGMSHRDLLS